ncbi:hypothetical protein EAI_16089 [Harpegnathos saltator]|uniref:Uncharacterized protein n=1 Tax=Harpegnathos saltator TaxID=610380 RepID=E2B2I0_HARSA|nr:hypothetical protein EAI_16089 [Harpegnathos saltator]
MRSLLTTALCLFMAVCILANDFERGERKTGDHSVTDEFIIEPEFPWIALEVTIDITCPPNETITYVKISSIKHDKDVSYQLLAGNVGTSSLVVVATGKIGEGLSLRVQGYCINLNTIISDASE